MRDGRFAGIYGIVDDATASEPFAFADALLAAGIAVLQYRAKRGVDYDVLRGLHERTQRANALLIVNDDFEAAMHADGWHAGPEDLSGLDLAAVRARLASRVFGVSAGVPQEARAAEAAGADYVGTGPFANTATKGDAGAPIGAAGVRAVVTATRLPVVAIGGIDLSNLADVAGTGAAMAAVISALARSADPSVTARQLVAIWRSARS